MRDTADREEIGEPFFLERRLEAQDRPHFERPLRRIRCKKRVFACGTDMLYQCTQSLRLISAGDADHLDRAADALCKRASPIVIVRKRLHAPDAAYTLPRRELPRANKPDIADSAPILLGRSAAAPAARPFRAVSLDDEDKLRGACCLKCLCCILRPGTEGSRGDERHERAGKNCCRKHLLPAQEQERTYDERNGYSCLHLCTYAVPRQVQEREPRGIDGREQRQERFRQKWPLRRLLLPIHRYSPRASRTSSRLCRRHA